jgi:hypothetical protein
LLANQSANYRRQSGSPEDGLHRRVTLIIQLAIEHIGIALLMAVVAPLLLGGMFLLYEHSEDTKSQAVS